MMEVNEIVERYCDAMNRLVLEALWFREDYDSVQALNPPYRFAAATRHVRGVREIFQPVPNFRAEIMRGAVKGAEVGPNGIGWKPRRRLHAKCVGRDHSHVRKRPYPTGALLPRGTGERRSPCHSKRGALTQRIASNPARSLSCALNR